MNALPPTARIVAISTPAGGDDSVDFVPVDQVGDHARRGAVWSGLQIVVRNAISVGSTAILARLLSPGDYGLTAMVATLTALLLVFSDMGLSWATIQRAWLTRAQVTTLFWINAAAGAGLWLVCVALAPLIAGFYGRTELVAVTMAMGAGFLISGLAAQPMALMTRSMDLRRIALIEITGVVVGVMTAIAVAGAGGGYWALVAQGLANALARTTLALTLGPWRFALPRRGVQVWALISFGGLLTANGLLLYLTRTLDSVLIGRVWGADALGLYSRAYFLMLLPTFLINGVLTRLVVPSLAALQDDRARFAEAYRRTLRLAAYAGMPMAVGLGLTAGHAVQIIYGANWTGVVPILMWLSIAAVTQPIYDANGWLFTAAGQGQAFLGLTAVNVVVLSAMFVLTVSYGAVAMARGYGLIMGLIIPLPALWLAHRAVGIRLGPTLKVLAPVVLLNGLMGTAVWTSGLVLEQAGLPWLTTFAVQVGTGVAVYLVLTPILLQDMVARDLVRFIRRPA